MRRRVHYASWVVAALSALWLGVVCEYSIGRDRQQKKLSLDLSDLSKRLDRLSVRLSLATNALAQTISISETYSLAPSSPSIEESEPIFEPVLRGRGQTKGPRAVYVYEDWEMQPGVVSRRYVLRLPYAMPTNSP